MKFFTTLDALPAVEKVVLCIGFFDGLHRGHQAVIERARQLASEHKAECWVMTFANHPATILRPDKAPKLLTPNARKAELLNELGIDTLLMPSFTTSLSQQSPDDFFSTLTASIPGLMAVCVGHNWRFGKDAAGTPERLKDLGGRQQISVHIMEPVKTGDKTVISSTLIRSALMNGQFHEAAEMLGRAWTFRGKVVKGSQLGSKLGFPTANLETDDHLLLPKGVFAARISGSDSDFDGVVNVGCRPTVHKNGPLTAEAHLLDTQGDFYGKELHVQLVGKIRNETHFSSKEALQEQIQKDIHSARDSLARGLAKSQ